MTVNDDEKHAEIKSDMDEIKKLVLSADRNQTISSEMTAEY